MVCTTAYDAAFATLADAAGVDVILVGDSLGNTMLGFPSTIPVTADMIAHHTAAVARARPNALVVADVPFAETAYPFEHLLTTCVRFVQHCGADAVKIEGGVELAETVLRLTRAGIPVMGHIGLLPQRINQIGGYRRYGKNEEEIAQLAADARAVEAAGAFAIVGEMIDHEDYLTRSAAIAAIADYIDGFYNPCRRHSAIDYVSPIEFELKFMSEKIRNMAA